MTHACYGRTETCQQGARLSLPWRPPATPALSPSSFMRFSLTLVATSSLRLMPCGVGQVGRGGARGMCSAHVAVALESGRRHGGHVPTCLPLRHCAPHLHRLPRLNMDGDLLLLPLDRQLHRVGCGWGGGRLCTARILRLQGEQTVAVTAAHQSTAFPPSSVSSGARNRGRAAQPWLCSAPWCSAGRATAALPPSPPPLLVTRALHSAGPDQCPIARLAARGRGCSYRARSGRLCLWRVCTRWAGGAGPATAAQ